MATSEADGSYELSGLPAGELTMVVAAEGFVPHYEPIQVAGDARADFRLSRGLALAGRVVADRAPVAGARIGASSAALRGQEQSALSDAEGRFTLTGLVPVRYTLSAFREGLGSHQLEGVDPQAGEPVVIDLSRRPTAVVHGVVTGLPAAPRGARVTRRIVSATGTSEAAEADVLDGGAYRIEGAPTGVVQLRAIVETPGGMWSSRELLVELEPGEERRVDLDLSTPLPVQGQVRLDGRPLGGAYVVFELPGGAPVSTRTGEDGAYAVELPGPGSYRVRVHSEHESAAHQQSVHEIDGPRTLDLDLRAREVRGRVVAAGSGEPIAGALVSLRAAGGGLAVLRLSETMTGPSGQFVLHGVGAEPAEIVAAAAGFGQHAVALSADETTEVVVELEPAEPLRVMVVETGSEVPLQAHLEVRDAAGTPLPTRAELLADGTHELTLAPGRYLLTAIVAGHGQRTVAADAPGTLRLEVEPGGDLLLESDLVQSDLAGAQLRLRDAAGVEQLPCCALAGWPLLGNGAWLRGLAPGRYAVEVIDREGRVLGSASATVVAGETTRLALD